MLQSARAGTRRIAGRLFSTALGTIAQNYRLLRQGSLYLWARASGRSYADYFAWLMDRSIRDYPNWGEGLDYRYQIDYLIKHGLRPESKLLDLGCGPLAAGVLMIQYLHAGNYVGADVSSGVIAEAAKRVEQNALASKQPTLIHFRHGSLQSLHGRSFDIIWAQSVLTHMPAKEIDELLRDIRPCMNAHTLFLATFARGDKARHVGFMHWYLDTSTVRTIAERNGFAFEIMDDWRHPLDQDGTDTMARMQLRSP